MRNQANKITRNLKQNWLYYNNIVIKLNCISTMEWSQMESLSMKDLKHLIAEPEHIQTKSQFLLAKHAS